MSYYSKLKRFAKAYVIREADAENIVQDIFLNLWEKKDIISQHTNLNSFLYTAVKNKCLDFMRHKQVVKKTTDKLQKENTLEIQLNLQSLESLEDKIFTLDIEQKVEEAIKLLPPRCREVFILNKIKGKKQKEIAKELNISINTVENQMTIAYKKLKTILKEYL